MSSEAVAPLSAEEQEALKAATFQRLHPRIYLERFLAQNVRTDGRVVDQFRDVVINVGAITTADGSALVRLGDTTVVCGVKAEIAEPELDRPNDGFLVPNLDLPALCSPRFKPGPPSEEAQVLSDRLNEILLSSGMLPTSALCIAPGKAVWTLYVDAVCINHAGNAFDAALLAVVAALRNTRLPKATYHEDSGETTCVRNGETVPLPLVRTPLPATFGVFSSTHLLADPSAFEEPLLDASLTVVLDEHDSLISYTQLGSRSGAGDRAAHIALAQARCRVLRAQLIAA